MTEPTATGTEKVFRSALKMSIVPSVVKLLGVVAEATEW